jgi:hypothetical protein
MEVMEKKVKTRTKAEQEEQTDKALAIYESIKDQYEPQHNGEFLLIDTESKRVFWGKTWDEAFALGEKVRRPGQIFFLLKIGVIDVGTI